MRHEVWRCTAREALQTGKISPHHGDVGPRLVRTRVQRGNVEVEGVTSHGVVER